jgi:hypothetical protein
MTTELLAFDRGSVRKLDKVGRLQIGASNISKANVCGYYGREIPKAEELGLDPDKLYQLYRDPEELKKAASTFNNIPVHQTVHIPDFPNDPPRNNRVGVTHSNCTFDGTYLINGLSIWDNSAIAGIETEEQEQLSSSYQYRADMTPGTTPDGVHFDGVIRDIVGNHVCLVGTGRAGADVVVGDSLPQELKHMKLDRKAVAIRAALGVYLKPRLAQDAAIKDLTSIISTSKRPLAIASAVVTKYTGKLAADMEIEPTELAQLLESAEAVVEPEEAEAAFDDADACASVMALLEGKVPEAVLATIKAALTPAANDTDPETTKEDLVDKPAMDAAIKLAADSATKKATANFNAIRTAETEVRPLIGDVIAMDSAEEVYRTALEQNGVDLTDVHPSAYRSMVQFTITQKSNATTITPRIAMDSSVETSFAEDFPTAGKLKRG